MKRSPLCPTAEKLPARIAFVRDHAYPLDDHHPAFPVKTKDEPVEMNTSRRTLVPPSSYSAMRSVFLSKFASVAAHFIRPRSKEPAPPANHSATVNFSVVAEGSRSRSWIFRLRLSVGSEIVAIWLAPVPLKSPERGMPAAGVCASAVCCAGMTVGMSQTSEIASVSANAATRLIAGKIPDARSAAARPSGGLNVSQGAP